MDIIFFGSSDFGIPSLEYLKEKHNLLHVVTNPDKPKGRHLKILPTQVKEWAEKTDTPILQPESLSDTSFVSMLKSEKPEMIILISYGGILPQQILDIPRTGCINLHPSLLPKYRGAAPIEWALINGEKITGITVIKMVTDIDSGNIILQKEIPITEEDNYYSLKEKLMRESTGPLKEAIEKLSSGFSGIPQKEKPTYAPKLKKEDGHINWEKDVHNIHNLVRGLMYWPGAFSYLVSPKGKRIVKIRETEIEKPEGRYGIPGNFVSLDNTIKVACGKGMIKIKKVQMEGKKEISSEEFLRGYLHYLENACLK